MNIQELCDLKISKDYKRLGKLFYTSKSAYLYDTGTGKVTKLDQDSQKLLESLFDDRISYQEFLHVLSKTADIDKITKFFEEEHLLSNPSDLNFIPLEDTYSVDNIKCMQLIIELTGNCNLRCKYCIYNDFYEGNRNFNTSNIDFETAQKAIDYVFAHRDPEHLAITFYGGEPLLNFPVMKRCIDYCLEKYESENVSFSFTTNLTLMTEEIAEYLAKIPRLSIMISIDGPEEIHNAARVNRERKGSFKDAFSGLKILSNAIRKYKNTNLLFSVVLMPPYTSERFDKINDFFESLDFLPEGTTVRATYPTPGTISTAYLDDMELQGFDLREEVRWSDWAREKAKSKNFDGVNRNLYSEVLIDSLVSIHNRILRDKPVNVICLNGCCIPGHRRLYVCTDGTYKVCERVGSVPAIGHVDTGIDIESVRKYYLIEFERRSLPECSKCWAVNMCDICYAHCYNEKGLDISKKNGICASTKARLVAWLQYYHELLESHPERIEEIAKMELL